jgi:hypothetical protein
MENTAERGRPRMTKWRIRIACWITKVTHAFAICNTYCISSATAVKRMRLDVTLYIHCLSCVYLRTNNDYFLTETILLVFINEV